MPFFMTMVPPLAPWGGLAPSANNRGVNPVKCRVDWEGGCISVWQELCRGNLAEAIYRGEMVSSLLLCWQARLTGCMPHACYVATCSRAFLLCALFKLLVGLVHKSFFTAALGPQFSIAAPGILNSTRPGRSAHTTEQEACTISAWRCTSASG